MKRKDDPIRLAFGELSDDAARAVEAKADDAQRAEVAAFRSLHDGLRHLPPPPPDNLTAERLRAAILDRELKSRRPFAWGPAFLAPVAVAALAAVVLLPRLRPRPEPQIVGPEVARLEPRHEFDFPSARAFAGPKPLAVPSAAGAAKASGPVRTDEPDGSATAISTSHLRHPRHRTPVEASDEPQMRTDGMVVFGPQRESTEVPASFAAPIHDPQTIAAPPSTVVEAVPGGMGKTETVVIVSSKRDLETGAPAATEKEATSVLVGG